MGRIRLLPNKLVNQIAAGEVVERPASVVKELVENALDAGATRIEVKCVSGGASLITVSDNGYGMTAEDALVCVQRHATSKLPTDESLFAIVTKGFRGEALPSIASVSQFRLETSEPGSVTGTRVTIAGGDAPVVEPCAAVGGTRIDVESLFFNVPARRKFLKREATEALHCQEAVLRLSLSHPTVAFSFAHNDKIAFSLLPSARAIQERLCVAVGPEVEEQLLQIESRRLGLSVTGWVAAPEFTLSTARGLYTFVNGRYIRDRGLLSGIQRAFQERIPPGRQPVGAIFVEVAPEAVDVNVHPQKLEVRFADPRAVIEAVSSAIAEAMKMAPFRGDEPHMASPQTQAQYAQAVDRFLSLASDGPLPMPATAIADFGQRPAFGTARVDVNTAPPPSYYSRCRFLGDLGQRYWVCEGVGFSLLVIDPQAVRQRLAFHQLQQDIDRRRSAESTAPGLFQSTVVANAALSQKLLVHRETLSTFQLEVEPFGPDSAAVKSVPACVEQADVALMLSDVIDALEEHPPNSQRVLLAMSAHAVTAERRRHSHDEVHRLLAALDDVEHRHFEGQPAVVLHDVPFLDFEQNTLR